LVAETPVRKEARLSLSSSINMVISVDGGDYPDRVILRVKRASKQGASG